MATVSLQAAYDQARRLLESGDTERAAAVTQHILQHFPRNLEAQRLFGEIQLASRHLQQAQDSFQTVLTSDPENIPAYVGQGVTYERQGDLDKAIQSFEHALEIKPDMPELRSQLLRLYTETWGNEGAQLRLSRAGLARLYAKGHMLPQAIQEFRSVISEQPERLDARVALAEVLWRDEQEEDAADTCEDILRDDPYALKPNLLLGYLRLAQGDAQGEEYWNRSLDLDPYQTVARAMFDQLPYATPSQPTLPEWDEQSWQSQRDRQMQVEQDQHRAEQETHAAPVSAASGAVAAAATGTDEDFFGGSWMDTVGQSANSQPSSGAGADDDFLANLLAFDGLHTDPDLEEHVDTDIAPFSVDDVALLAEPFAFEAEPFAAAQPTVPEVPAPPASDVGDVPAPPTSDEDDLIPFSLADLGLSEEEIAHINQGYEQDELPADADALVPFSMSDLGFDDDEMSSETTMFDEERTQPAGQIGALMNTPPEPTAEEEPELTPFSLTDLGLSDNEIAQLNQDEGHPLTTESSDIANVKPFSFDDWGLDEGGTALQTSGDDDGLGLSNDLQPFSLDDLDISNNDSQDSYDVGGLPSSLQPFSLDDLADTQSSMDAQANFSGDVADDAEARSDAGGYSFRQAPARANTSFGRDQPPHEEQGRTSIFAKLKQRHEELPYEEPPPLAPVADDEMDMSLFGNDDISLRDETIQLPAVTRPVEPTLPAEEPTAQPAVPASDEATLTPFSLSDLGLTPEEIASFGLEQPASQQAAVEPEAPVEAAADETVFTANDEPDLTPFSLSDLGLSPEEIAALGLDEPDTVVSNGPVASESVETTAVDLPIEQAPVGNDISSPDAEFDFDLLGEQPTALTAKGQESAFDDDDDIRPFSIEDLGLDDDELSPFSGASNELGLTEEELAGMDLGALEQADGLRQHEDAEEEEYQVDTGDSVLDRLITIGRRQGFVDLDDIIQAVDNPEEESDRIEEIGLVLHRAGVQIRDGDEIIDMDEEEDQEYPVYTDEEQEPEQASIAPVTSTNEPDLTPFSLSDLGLLPEEIASLGLEETTPAAEASASAAIEPSAVPAPPISSEEPDLTPFSLSDLGLTPEEIAALNLSEGESSAPTPEPTYGENQAAETVLQEEPTAPAEAPMPLASSEEPDLTPFSLSDLGLTPEEIAALNFDEGEPSVSNATPTAPVVEVEPILTPFSLSDLGLTPEEIATLNFDEGEPSEPAATPTAPVASEPAAVPTTPTAEEASDMTPFSLSDLGLTPEEIATLSMDEEPTAPAEEPAAPATLATEEEPELIPFSLSDLGLSPEEIAALGLDEASATTDAAATGATGDDFDPFDFSEAEAVRSDVVPLPTQPRVREEELPPPQSPEDAAFVPKALEELDSIWDDASAQPTSVYVAPAPEPAAVQPPAPPQPTRDVQPASERIVRIEKPTREPERREAQPPARQPEAPRQPEVPPARQPQPEAPRAPRLQQRPSGAWKLRQSPIAFIPTGDGALDGYLLQLEAEPNNTILRTAVARLGGQTGHIDLAIQQYKALIKSGNALDLVTEDLQELIEDTEDPPILQRLYRLLGDVYSKQNRFRDAVEAYSWTFAKE